MSASQEYQNWMNTIQESVTISLSPSTEKWQLARAEYEALTGTDDMYEHIDIWKGIIGKYYTEQVHKGISLKRAQEIAEPIRIAHPDECVSIYSSDKSFIGNTSWNDQMKMFWEYETYTPEGAALAAARKAEAEKLGLKAAWE